MTQLEIIDELGRMVRQANTSFYVAGTERSLRHVASNFLNALEKKIGELAEAYHRETNHHFLDFGAAGVATVHRYEVRTLAAGRCNLVASFTDPHRAAQYAEELARAAYAEAASQTEDGEFEP